MTLSGEVQLAYYALEGKKDVDYELVKQEIFI